MVDMSTEQVVSLSSNQKTKIVRCIQSLALLGDNWTLKLDSRLWLKDDKESTLSQVYPEWGVSMGIPGSVGADLIPELRGDWQFVAKKHYSSFVDSALQDVLDKAEITDVYIVGINTDYCIFNTAMDSFSRGRFRTYVIEDGVGSISGKAGHEQGLRWIRAHLGLEAVVSMNEALKKISSSTSSCSS